MSASVEYAALREEAIDHLERMTGGEWTDFNAHDPGITILEQLCFALTDLLYRSGFDIPDLMAGDGNDPYRDLFGAGEILTGSAVTLDDLRRLILDVEGVRNAWVEPVEQKTELHYHPVYAELGLTPRPPASEAIELRGLYRVLIETSDLAGVDGSQVRAAVALRVHENRNLCEDFAEIRVLERQPVRVDANIEIGPGGTPELVLADIYESLADHISPSVEFSSVAEALASGEPIDRVLDGPRLDNGFIGDEALAGARRRLAIHTSDLIHSITEVPGVRAIRKIAVGSRGRTEPWSLDLDPDRAPKLDLHASTIVLERSGLATHIDEEEVLDIYLRRRVGALQASNREADARALAPPRGRDRGVGEYRSIQHETPGLYGIGEAGLPDFSTPDRRARAKQLKAYLLLFDQLLANEFAQLARSRDLFSFSADPRRTYFAQTIRDPRLRLDDVRPGGDEHEARVHELAESAGVADGERRSLDRRERFLNHLLARFAEHVEDHSVVLRRGSRRGSGSQAILEDREAYLRRYPRISGARGTGMNYLLPRGPANLSGLEERVRLLLGLRGESGEDVVLVEHVLLRPVEGDEEQTVPLLAEAASRDPYSLQLSFVFPRRGRLSDSGFRGFAERAIRDETPAHLTPVVRFLAGPAWEAFEQAHDDWLGRQRQHWVERLGLALDQE